MSISKNVFNVLCISLLILNCGIGEDNSDNTSTSKISLSGIFKNYAHKRKIQVVADKIYAVRMANGVLDVSDISRDIKIIDIASDGSFSLEFTKEDGVEWILMMTHSTAANKKDGVLGYVALSNIDAAYKSTLIRYPVDDMDSDLDMGEIELPDSNMDAVSDVPIDTIETVNLTLANLKEMALVDDQLRILKNMYINTNMQTGKRVQVRGWIGYVFKSATQNITSIVNSTVLPEAYNFADATSYYGAYIDCNELTVYSIEAIKNNISITPPSPVVINSETLSELTFENANVTNAGFFGMGPITGITIPIGYWDLKMNGSTTASFDLGIGLPTDENNKPIGYVPSFSLITTGADSSVQTLSMSWYYNENGTFKKVTDFSVMKRTISLMLCEILGTQNGQDFRFAYDLEAETSSVDVSGDTMLFTTIKEITVSYYSAASSPRFSFARNE